MNQIFIILICTFLVCCATHQHSYQGIRESESCPINIDYTTAISSDSTYGYTKENAIRVGNGPRNEYEYLSNLLGPNESKIDSIHRIGSVSSTYKDGRLLLLDAFTLYINGKSFNKVLYLDMYNCEDVLIPRGFTYKK